MMFLAALVEVSIWAAAYLVHGALSDVETALYFSMVTFTTLGYGDMTPQTSAGMSLATLIAVTGQIYVAVIIAMLVGKFSSQAE